MSGFTVHTRYISCGLSKEDFLKFSPIISLWKLLIPCDIAILTPMGLIGRIYIHVCDH